MMVPALHSIFRRRSPEDAAPARDASESDARTLPRAPASRAALLASPQEDIGSPEQVECNGSPSRATTLLEARGIGRRLRTGASWLFQQLSLQLRPRERIAIMGPTGAGKTVFLRALALLDPIDAGEILWQGKPVETSAAPTFRRQVMYVHQRPALFAGTVEDNLRRPCKLQIHRDIQFNRPLILDLLGKIRRGREFLSRSERDLSEGERQIVALLRAIQFSPTVLLLDEPTASLDADTTEAVELLVQHWREQSASAPATVWISHDADQVRRIADRVLTMQTGELREDR